MYTKTALISAALMASTALAGSPGRAHIINSCSYPVYLSAVPAAGGGYDESTKTLQPGESWDQQWTQLSNGNGWSLKLSKDSSLKNILQYEYTYHNDGIIWYDLSCVDGNPWAANWQVSSSDAGCSPRQTYYRYDTDDAFGMQDCPSDSSVTVTLCTAESQFEGLISSVVAAVTKAVDPSPVAVSTPVSTPAVVVPAAAPTTTHTTEPAYTAPVQTGHALGFNGQHFYNADVDVKAPAPTTFATIATPVVNSNDDMVTVIETVIETAYAYETYVPEKRHIHHPNHPHFA